MDLVLVALLACQVFFRSDSKRVAGLARRLPRGFKAIVMVALQVGMQNPWSGRQAHRAL